MHNKISYQVAYSKGYHPNLGFIQLLKIKPTKPIDIEEEVKKIGFSFFFYIRNRTIN